MPSQLAILLAAPSADEDDNPDMDAVAWCDSKLQEVREVVEFLYGKQIRLSHPDTRWEGYERVRNLMDRLRIVESEDLLK